MNKTIIAGLVALAFVAGSIMTGTMADAAKGKPFQEVLDAIAGLQTSVDGIDPSGVATQSSVDDISTALGNLQSDVDDIKLAQVVAKSILCGIATSPDCIGP